MDWAKTIATGYRKHLNFEIWCDLYFYGRSIEYGSIKCYPEYSAFSGDGNGLSPVMNNWINAAYCNSDPQEQILMQS